MPRPDVLATAGTATARSTTPWTFEAIGTRWRLDGVPEGAVRVAVSARIDAFDRTWSRFRADSLVTELRETCGPVPFPAEAAGLLAAYDRWADATAGAVSPLVGEALEHLGYDATLNLVPRRGRRPAPSADVLVRTTSSTGATLLHLTEPALLDVGAAGKGLLVDLVADLLDAHGLATWTVDASGDLRHRGTPLRVALEHPYDPTKAIGVVGVVDGALAASASNRRRWGSGLHHVIDATTGAPVDEIAATWVLAPRAVDADGLATVLFHRDPADAPDLFAGVDWVRMWTDGRVRTSPGLRTSVFTR